MLYLDQLDFGSSLSVMMVEKVCLIMRGVVLCFVVRWLHFRNNLAVLSLPGEPYHVEDVSPGGRAFVGAASLFSGPYEGDEAVALTDCIVLKVHAADVLALVYATATSCMPGLCDFATPCCAGLVAHGLTHIGDNVVRLVQLQWSCGRCEVVHETRQAHGQPALGNGSTH